MTPISTGPQISLSPLPSAVQAFGGPLQPQFPTDSSLTWARSQPMPRLGPTCGISSPGLGGTGQAVSIPPSSFLAARAALTTYIVPPAVLGGIPSCIGDGGGPGITNGTNSYFQLQKTKVYTLSFYLKNTGGDTHHDF